MKDFGRFLSQAIPLFKAKLGDFVQNRRDERGEGLR
jgi:hypothetical protein